MKKILFVLMACMCITYVNAQDRIDEVEYNFISKSEIVSSITGWGYNEGEGKWIGEPNDIYGSSLKLNTVQIKSFNYNDDIKYVLIISSGIFDTELVFILTDEQYNHVVNPNEYTQFVTPCFEYNGDRTDNWIIRQIIKLYKLEYSVKYKLAIKKYKDVVRFIYAEDRSYCGFDLTDDITMNKRYFEIPYNEWIKLSSEKENAVLHTTPIHVVKGWE